ncbi:MAG: GAF domain-containing protein [Chloroflexi bacterium]|nr:GAF domain-containing protein [Chloroflexota bacterium]
MTLADDFYQYVFTMTSEGAFQSTPRGRYLRVNAAMAAMYGYDSPEEMIAKIKDVEKQVYLHPEDYEKLKRELATHGRVENFECEHVCKNGDVIRVSSNIEATSNENGKITHYNGLTRVVRPVEEDGFTEARYRTLVEQAPVAVYIGAPNNNLQHSIYVSPQIEAITGYTAKEWNTQGFWVNTIHPDDRERFVQENERTDSTGETFDLEYRIAHKNGAIVWLRDLATLTRHPDGAPLYWQGTLIDITEQKKLQESIRQSEDRFRKAFLSSPIAICITSLEDGIFLDMNEAYLKLSGFDREKILGRSAIDMIFTDEPTRAAWLAEFLSAGQSLHRQNAPFITASGQALETLAFYEGIEAGGQKAILSMFYDVTNQRRAERALEQSEARYRALVEHIPAIVYLDEYEGEQKTLYLSPQVETITGYAPEEWKSAPDFWENRIHPVDRERVIKKDSLTNATGSPFSEEYRFLTQDGRWIWLQEESSLIRDAEGNPLFWQGFLLDITSKHEAQEALGEVARAYRSLFDSVSDAIYIQDQDGRFLDVNLGAEKMYGYPRDFFLGKTPEFLSAPNKNNLEEVAQALARAFAGETQQFEFWGLRSNGEIFPKDVHVYNGEYFGQNVVFAIARDITEQRKTQDKRERQLKELSILHALAVEGTRIQSEDELIGSATDIIGYTLYPDSCGFLILTEDGKWFSPHSTYRGVTHSDEVRVHPVGEGVAGQVAQTGRAVNIRDVQELSNYICVNPNTLSELCVPMKIGDRVIGVINAESAKRGFFTEDDERLLLTVASQVATGIERIRKERAEREQRNLAEALRDIASVLNSTLEFDKVMERILANIDRVVPSRSANIMLLENDQLRIILHRGYTTDEGPVWMEKFKLKIRDLPDLERGKMTSAPQLVADTRLDPNWVAFPATNWILSHLTAPILEENKVIGFINLDHDTANFFTQQDVERLQAFANQAASAIVNSRRFEEETRRARIIEALAEIANVIATSREVNFMLDEIARRSLQLLNARDVAFYLLQDDNKTLKIVTACGQYKDELLSHTLEVGRGITGRIVVSGKAEIINNMGNDPRRVRVPGTPEEDALTETMMSAPLILRDKVIGAMNAWRVRERGLFTETELNFLVSIAHQASIAIESGRLFEETLRQAQETEAIAEVGRDISSTLRLDLVLERIAAYARDLLQSETSAVYLVDENTAELRAIAALGAEADEIKSDPIQVGVGILGNIALQKTGEIVNETMSDSRAIIIKGTESAPNEHIMGVPVLLKNELTGLLVVWRIGKGQDYKPTDLNFLASLAQQAAVAIENARLFRSEEQRRQEAETLREATAVVATTLDRGRAIELILDQLARVLKYDSASVQLLRGGYLEIVGGRGWPSERDILGLRFPVPGNNPNSIVIKERRPFVINQVNRDYPTFGEPPHAHIRSWMGVPLIAHGDMIGMLAVDSKRDDAFNIEHLRLISAYANQAAIAIDNAQLHERSEIQIRRLTALRDVDTAIASSLDLRVTLNILIDNAASQLRADGMSIFVYNPSLQILESAATLGMQNRFARRQVRIGEDFAGKIAITRQPLEIENLLNSANYSPSSWWSEEKFVTYIGYPLIGKGQLKGVLEAYFREPFTPDLDWNEFMQTMAGQAAIAIDNALLFENLQRSNQELSLAYDTTLEGWGKALELRDKETQGHTRRVAELTFRLARRMNISDAEITHIHRGVLLHDIGKMGVPDQILRKTGPLDETEWNQMRKHPQYAYDLLYPISYLRPALDIPYCHHEKWDGTGYPSGLKGENIPLAARIFTVVDVWDALLSDRPYRKTWTKEQTLAYIRNESGTRFDPRVVDVFLEMMSETE